MAFDKIVSLTKRNNIYFGTTDSYKVATSLEEICVDLDTIYNQFNIHQRELTALASGYLDPNGRLRDIGAQISEIENEFEKMTYIYATQDPIF